MPNEITKVRLVIREFIWTIREIRKSKDASWEWLNSFADTLQYQDLQTEPNVFGRELLREARGFADTKKRNQQLRWIRESFAKEGVTSPTNSQLDERWRQIYGAAESKGYPNEKKVTKQQKAKPQKSTFGEFGNVTLSDEESAKLQSRLGPAGFQRGIEVLGAWKANNPAKAAKIRSDYACFSSWVIRRLDEEKAEAARKSAPKPFAEQERDRMAEIVRNEFPSVIEEFDL